MAFFKDLFNNISKTFSNNSTDNQSSDNTVINTSQTSSVDSETETAGYFTAKLQLSDKSIDKKYIDNLEEQLILGDLSIDIVDEFIEQIKKENKKEKLKETEIPAKLQEFLENCLKASENKTRDKFNPFKLFEKLRSDKESDKVVLDKSIDHQDLNNDNDSDTESPKKITKVIMFLGVNGVGKTTSIAKLANRLVQENQKVLVAAGDTFRAAAESQLRFWANKVGADFIELAEGSKSSAVVFKAIEKLKLEGHDFLIIDTAGRLQNKQGLMDELAKIHKVIEKNLEASDTIFESILVIDANTGKNAINQAEEFSKVTNIDSIFLSKFDGSAKAGSVFSIARKFKIPVRFIGTGEKESDIQDFDAKEFVAKLFV